MGGITIAKCMKCGEIPQIKGSFDNNNYQISCCGSIASTLNMVETADYWRRMQEKYAWVELNKPIEFATNDKDLYNAWHRKQDQVQRLLKTNAILEHKVTALTRQAAAVARPLFSERLHKSLDDEISLLKAENIKLKNNLEHEYSRLVYKEHGDLLTEISVMKKDFKTLEQNHEAQTERLVASCKLCTRTQGRLNVTSTELGVAKGELRAYRELANNQAEMREREVILKNSTGRSKAIREAIARDFRMECDYQVLKNKSKRGLVIDTELADKLRAVKRRNTLLTIGCPHIRNNGLSIMKEFFNEWIVGQMDCPEKEK